MIMMHRTFANELLKFREKSIKESLNNSDTLLILVHRHRSNDYREFVRSRISVNIIHKTSILNIMAPMITMIMTQLFRTTYRGGEPRKRIRDHFTSFNGYDSFMEEDHTEKKYAFRSEIFSKKIEAYHFSKNLEVTSLCLDFITAKKTQLYIQNMARETTSIIGEMSDCIVQLM